MGNLIREVKKDSASGKMLTFELEIAINNTSV